MGILQSAGLVRQVGFAGAAIFYALGATCALSQDQGPPNILLVIADDMGLDASPCYDIGEQKPDMPVLDAMCANGLVFDNLWSQPVCSPTRATLLTGRYGFRTGVLAQVAGPGGVGIGTDERSIQRLLDERAPTPYAHAVVGKWHLSDSINGGDENPEVMGVGFYSGLIRGAVRDYYHFDLTTEGESKEVDGYATTVFTDIAIDWLAEQKEPWFLWLAYNAPHTPFHVPPPSLHDRQLVDSEEAIKADPLPYFLAALEALDREMGRLLDTLDEATLANTVIVFIGDNGTDARVAQAPYTRRTVKGTLYPGGIRVPMVVSGVGVARKGGREAALVNTTDIFATIADFAGVGADFAQDGVSFKALLSDDGAVDRGFAYADLETDVPSTRSNGWSIRDRDFQLIVFDDGKRALFDLGGDPGGSTNLLEGPKSTEFDDIAAQLQAQGEMLRASK
ncbi:MAG: sulfatase-like hydrolase/transferase [Hyphomicrobiales bacterium]|nr:sulfatase-like hydrolase/transferase [Hyphomicrobiales bacterium]